MKRREIHVRDLRDPDRAGHRGVDGHRRYAQLMRRWLYEQSLSIFFLAIFLLAVIGQWIAGAKAHNAQQTAHGEPTVSYLDYLFSPAFGGDLLENWQSEFLQFTLFVLATVWFVQKGSNESKQLGEAGLESDQKQKVGGYADSNSPRWARVRGWRLALYENSLLIVMAFIFVGSWLGQSVSNWRQFNQEQIDHADEPVRWVAYLANPDFWNRTLQNWQSEFLAVGTMAVFTIYLRQRGSPESKPVGAAHETTAASG
jgi:hypothetical protein